MVAANEKCRWRLILAILAIASVLGAKVLQAETVGVIGDSISTGAVSHPDIYFDADVIWRQLRGDQNSIPRLGSDRIKRVGPDFTEYRGAMDWVSQNLVYHLMARFFDFPELSWVSSFLQENPGYNALIAAQDGARMVDLRTQLIRLTAGNGGKLPGRLLIFFTGNDICGPTLGMMTSSRDFAANLQSGLELISRLPRGLQTDIHVVNMLSIQQVAEAPSIQQKAVRAHGKVLTCKELQALPGTAWQSSETEFGYPVGDLLTMINFPHSPRSICPNLFGGNIDFQKDQIFTITGRLRAYRQGLQKTVAEVSEQWTKERRDELRISLIEDTEKIRFEDADIANDCFHLSPTGHAKVGKVIADSLRASAKI